MRVGLQERLGVTRVARVTGLDRVGVEVACAVRPQGHVLQVCNGKGRTWRRAAESAVMECAELWAAEHVDASQLRWSTVAALAESGALGVAPGELPGGRFPLDVTHARIAWREGMELFRREQAWVPAVAVHCPPPGAALLGPALCDWSSNGSGAHPGLAAARAHALFEAIERDQLALALPEGWTAEALAARRLSGAQLSPELTRQTRRLAAEGLQLDAFDLTVRRERGRQAGLGVPLGAVLLLDLERGPNPVAAGYASRPELSAALEAAFEEAAQTRLTDIHGAREDVEPMAYSDVDALFALMARVRSTGAPPRRLPPGVHDVLGALRFGGYERVVAVELGGAGLGVHVQKILVPGFRVSGLL